MFMTFEELQECIKKAEENGACSEELDIMKTVLSIEEFFSHPKCAYWLYWYAAKVMENRWLEAEEIIKNDSKWAFEYSFNVIRGRFTAAEEVIKQDYFYAYWYAIDVIKGRWPEAEDVLCRILILHIVMLKL